MRKETVYLAGSMENSVGLGKAWREGITPLLEKLNLEVLNPCNFEKDQLKGLHINRLPSTFDTVHGKTEKLTHWHQLKNASDPNLYKRFMKYMRRIINYDIKTIKNNTNYVIVKWDEETSKGAGTHAELTESFLNGIPVYCVLSGNMPAWTKACCTEIFNDFDDLSKFLVNEFGEL